jgi:hypothetical protein
MNVEIGAEAALFPEKEYIKGIFVAVLSLTDTNCYVAKCARAQRQRRHCTILLEGKK